MNSGLLLRLTHAAFLLLLALAGTAGAQEIQLATASQELGFINGLQSNLGKSNQLADGLGYHDDPEYYRKAYEARRAVTPDDVKRVANQYLSTGRVVLSVVPL